jgi:TonB family protein
MLGTFPSRAALLVVILATPICDDAFVSPGSDEPEVGDTISEDDNCRTVGNDYAQKVFATIKGKWSPPEAAERGWWGAVTLHFYIGRDGQVRDLETVRRRGPDSMETAALKAVTLSSPLPEPHFADPKCEQAGVTFNFFYNMGQKARERWLRKLKTVHRD